MVHEPHIIHDQEDHNLPEALEANAYTHLAVLAQSVPAGYQSVKLMIVVISSAYVLHSAPLRATSLLLSRDTMGPFR